MLKCHWFLTLGHEFFIQYIEHFQEGHVLVYVVELIGDKFAFVLAALSPDF